MRMRFGLSKTRFHGLHNELVDRCSLHLSMVLKSPVKRHETVS
jgi:hypothetical protein